MWEWLKRQFHLFGSPKYFYQWSCKWLVLFEVLTFSCLLIGLSWGLFIAPSDYQQGDSFRIIYVHVPAAIWSMGAYSAMAAMSVVYLVWRIKLAGILALSIAPAGALMAMLALLTGSLWGKPMWGAYWVWDARLTSELILLFLFMGVIMLSRSFSNEEKGQFPACVLAVVGFINVPIVHYSVEWWQTLHQGASITKFAKPSIDPTMLWPLLIMIAGFASYLVVVVLKRARARLLERESTTAWVRQILKENK